MGQPIMIVHCDEQGSITCHLRQAAGIAAHDGRRTGQRLQHGKAKSLIEAGNQHAGRAAVERRQVGVGDVAGELYVARQAKLVDQQANGFKQPTAPTHQQQAMRPAPRFEVGQRMQRGDVVLARL